MAMLDPRMFDPATFASDPFAQIKAAAQAPLGLLNQPGAFPDAIPPGATPTAGPPNIAPQPQPESPGLLSRLGTGLASNSNMLMALGAGIAGGKDWGEGISKGLTGAMAGSKMDRERGAGNLTLQALLKRGVDPETAQAAIRDPNVLKALLPSLFKAQQTSDITEYEYAKKQGFKGSLSEWMAQKRAGAGEYGLNPIWGRDNDGNPVMLQAGKSGTAIQSKLPEGISLSGKEPIKMDAGTHFVLMDPLTRQTIGIVPKDIAGKERQAVVGKQTGEAQVGLPNVLAKAEQSIKLIDDMISHPGRETATGLSSWVDPRNYVAGTSATNFRVRSEQLQGRAFLEAFESLKGAGQISEIEGKKATEAIARLNRAQSDEEYKGALTELRGILQGGMERARTRAGQPPAAPAPTAPPARVRTYNPATGQLE